MKFIPKIILALNSIAYIALGILCYLDPNNILEKVSLAATSSAGFVEFCTFYAGFMVGIGLFFLAGIFSKSVTGPALLFAVLTYGAAVLTRATYSLAENAFDSSYIQKMLIVESLGFVLSTWAYVIHKRQCKTT